MSHVTDSKTRYKLRWYRGIFALCMQFMCAEGFLYDKACTVAVQMGKPACTDAQTLDGRTHRSK